MMKKIFALVCILLVLILFGCVNKSEVKQKIDRADKLVSYLSYIGFKNIDDQELVKQAKSLYDTLASRDNLTSTEEDSIKAVAQKLDDRLGTWELYYSVAKKPDVETYFESHPDRKQFWSTLVMGVVKEGMNKTEVKLLLGEPNEKSASSADQKIYEKWIYRKANTPSELMFEGDVLQSIGR